MLGFALEPNFLATGLCLIVLLLVITPVKPRHWILVAVAATGLALLTASRAPYIGLLVAFVGFVVTSRLDARGSSRSARCTAPGGSV